MACQNTAIIQTVIKYPKQAWKNVNVDFTRSHIDTLNFNDVMIMILDDKDGKLTTLREMNQTA